MNTTDNSEEVEKIVKALADTPVSTLICSCDEAIFEALAGFMENADVNIKHRNEITYADALVLIDSLVTSGIYKSMGKDWCRNMQYNALAHLMKLLLRERKSNVAVNAFMSLTVKSYLCYLASQVGLTGKNTAILFETLRLDAENYINYSMNDETTIEMLLTSLNHFQSRCWLPAEPIEDFEKEIKNSYICLYGIMLKYFRKAFKEEFSIKKLQEKYEE